MTDSTNPPGKDPVFTPLDLESSIIAVPLLQKIGKEGPDTVQPVIIDLNPVVNPVQAKMGIGSAV